MTENNGTVAGTPGEHKPAFRKVYISRANAFKASKWLRKNREELAARNLNKRQIADECKAANQIPEMTENHLEGICEDFGIAPMWIRHKPASKRNTEGFANRHQSSRIVAIELLNVAAELDRLFTILGETFDPDKTINLSALRNIARGHTARAAEMYPEPAADGQVNVDPSEPVKAGTVRTVQ
jgi:hypothetical protein